MNRTDGLDPQMFARFAVNPGERPLLPPLTARAQVALMCRMLSREGWNEHIAGHITLRQPDGTLLTNPWELAWDELRASDIVTIDHDGKVLDSRWNTTPAIGLHLQLHRLRPDVNVVLHNHAHWSGIWASLQEVPPVYDQAGAYCGAELPLFDEYAGTFEKHDVTRAAAEALGGARWALLAHHGALVVGKDLRQAHLRVITLEWRCKRAYEVRVAGGGGNAKPLPGEVIDRLAVTDASGFPFCWEAMARRELRADPTVVD